MPIQILGEAGLPELQVSKDTEASRMLCEDAGCTLLAISGTGTRGGGGGDGGVL